MHTHIARVRRFKQIDNFNKHDVSLCVGGTSVDRQYPPLQPKELGYVIVIQFVYRLNSV